MYVFVCVTAVAVSATTYDDGSVILITYTIYVRYCPTVVIVEFIIEIPKNLQILIYNADERCS